MRIRRRRRDERGAVAILLVAMVGMLLIVGAMGIDLGNAMNRKRQTQTSSDLAALAGSGRSSDHERHDRPARRGLPQQEPADERCHQGLQRRRGQDHHRHHADRHQAVQRRGDVPLDRAHPGDRAVGAGAVRSRERLRSRRRVRELHGTGADRVGRDRHDAVLRHHGVRHRPPGHQERRRRSEHPVHGPGSLRGRRVEQLGPVDDEPEPEPEPDHPAGGGGARWSDHHAQRHQPDRGQHRPGRLLQHRPDCARRRPCRSRTPARR